MLAPPNVIVFGETGVGKSSIINMIAGKDVAEKTSSAKGGTFQNKDYPVMIDGKHVTLWDTAGLNEGNKGKVAAKDAIVNLCWLLRGLKDGVSLLVYCVRGRIKETTVKNYLMFYEAVCQSKVPIVMVANGLEEENPMDGWWKKNEEAYRAEKMIFSGHVCMTATKGKKKADGKYVYQDEYNESKANVVKLVGQHCFGEPWKAETKGWMRKAVGAVLSIWGKVFQPEPLTSESLSLIQRLKKTGMTEQEARDIVNDVEDKLAQWPS